MIRELNERSTLRAEIKIGLPNGEYYNARYVLAVKSKEEEKPTQTKILSR